MEEGGPFGPPSFIWSSRNFLELALNREGDDDAEQRGTFDERRKDQRGGLDLASGFRLTSHAFDGLAADAANAHASADDGEAGADA